MNQRGNSRALGLMLNALPLAFDQRHPVRISKAAYQGHEALKARRERLYGTHVVRRRGAQIEIVAIVPDAMPVGEIEVAAGEVTDLVACLLTEWLIEHFTGLGRRVFRRRGALVLVSDTDRDDLLGPVLPRGFAAPSWLSFRAAYQLDVRVARPDGRPVVFLTMDLLTRPCIDGSVSALLASGVDVAGLYVRRAIPGGDPRLADGGRLTGRVTRVVDDMLELADHDEHWPTLPAADATLEPRMDVLAHVVASLQGRPEAATEVLAQLRDTASRVRAGDERLHRLGLLGDYLRQQTVALAPGLSATFGEFVAAENRFPPCQVFSRPALIFDPSRRHTDRWNQRGLDQYGPYDKFRFHPKQLRIAVICQAALQGRMESFVAQFLHGVAAPEGGESGFLRRFALDKPYVRVFRAADSSASAYRQAAADAMEHSADHGKEWNLALVQIDESMETLHKDANPYLISKAFFLAQGIAVQHVHFETVQQAPEQLADSLNNIGLACYAKLGGVPWLLPTDHTVAHELVIGLGSYHERTSRRGTADRYVGITTVFSGDGRYLLQSRTRAVPFGKYRAAMSQAVRTVVGQVRDNFAWATTDSVRLIFHAFKPIRNAEAEAVHAFMREMALPQVEYAFVHVADTHPFRVFDAKQPGVPVGRDQRKGIHAPPRGLFVKLSNRDALVCLRGAHELKYASDAHPEPLMLHLHRNSSFRDITYLAGQIYRFSCHSWRSFLPAPLPISILYSQLVARNLRLLGGVSGWSNGAIVGRVGRTRWFL